MKFLAIDTATEACSVALYSDGEISEQYKVAPREHAHLVLPMAEQLLQAAQLKPQDLDAIAFGRGPGAFTGVRIAAGVVQGIACAAGLPVLGVSDLAAVALAAWRQYDAARILVSLDARMGEVYWGVFTVTEQGQVSEVTAEQLSAPGHVQCSGEFFAAGHGWSAYAELAQRFDAQMSGIDAKLLPRAADIARIAAPLIRQGQAVAAEQALPVYLREQVAWKRA